MKSNSLSKNNFNAAGFMKLGVAQKIWVGFAVVLAMLCFVVAISFFKLSDSEVTVDGVVNHNQPRALASLELSTHVQETASAISFYLLSRDAVHKKNYEQGVLHTRKSLETLKKLVTSENNPELSKQFQSIEALINKFLEYDTVLLPLATETMKNFPAIAYAGSVLGPINQAVLQNLSNMVMSEKEEESSAERKNFLLDIEAMRYNWSTIAGHIRTYMIMGEKTAMDNVILYYDEFAKLKEKVGQQSALFTFEQEEAYANIDTQSLKYRDSLAGLIAIFTSDKARMDAFTLKNDVGPLLLEINQALTKLVEKESSEINLIGSNLVASMAASKMFLLGLLAIGLSLGVIASILITRVIVRPIKDAVAAMKDIAQGEGDLTKRLASKGHDEVAQIAQGFNAFAEKIQNLISTSVGIMGQFDEKIGRVYTVSQETQQRADKQQLQTEEVAANVREVAQNVEAVTENAGLAVKAAETANDATTQGQKVVDDTILSIQSMASGVEKASVVINSLSQKTDKIGMVIDVIKGIAEQTNLLALNAAIEAARAGEQGRGFAVVADEVRTLASRTQQSTNEIENMIKELQADAVQATETMEMERKRAGESVDQATKTVSAFESIHHSVSTISEMNHKIEEAARIQQAKTEQVNSIIVQLLEIAEENAAGAQQTHSVTNELTQLEAELSKYMGQFKVS